MKAMTKTLLALSTTMFLATGCTPGDITGGGVDDPDPQPGSPDAGSTVDPADAAPPPDYAITVSPPLGAIKLAESTEFTVAVQPEHGFTGDVTLTVTGALPSWQVEFLPSPVISVGAGGVATATIKVTVPSDGEVAADGTGISTLTVQAEAAPGPRSQDVSVNVENLFVVSIPNGTGGNAVHPFPGTARIRMGAAFSILNADGTPHRIHSDSGGAGFPHQDALMSQGEAYTVNITSTGDYRYYCHAHGEGTGVGRIVVQ